jgi:TolB-like protein
MKILRLCILLLVSVLSSCAVLDHESDSKPLDRNAKWALLPIVNHTDVPQAGLRAESIAEVLLRARGISNLRRYPAMLNQDSLFEPAERQVVSDALSWAREQGVRYAVTGAVEEWHYKVGIDGEPAVGMTLQIIDLKDGDRVVWSAAGSKCGWSRDALSAVAQKLIKEMLSDAPIQ